MLKPMLFVLIRERSLHMKIMGKISRYLSLDLKRDSANPLMNWDMKLSTSLSSWGLKE